MRYFILCVKSSKSVCIYTTACLSSDVNILSNIYLYLDFTKLTVEKADSYN